MANFPPGTIVACADDTLAMVWDQLHAQLLGLPIKALKRARHRSDVVLSVAEAHTLLGPLRSVQTMVIETQMRVLIEPLECKVLAKPDPALIALVCTTIQRARESVLAERSASPVMTR